MFRLLFIVFRVIIEMKGDGIGIIIEIWVKTTITCSPDIFTVIIRLYPELINEYLLHLTIKVAVMDETAAIRINDYLQSITAWTLETTIGTAPSHYRLFNLLQFLISLMVNIDTHETGKKSTAIITPMVKYTLPHDDR